MYFVLKINVYLFFLFFYFIDFLVFYIFHKKNRSGKLRGAFPEPGTGPDINDTNHCIYQYIFNIVSLIAVRKVHLRVVQNLVLEGNLVVFLVTKGTGLVYVLKI